MSSNTPPDSTNEIPLQADDDTGINLHDSGEVVNILDPETALREFIQKIDIILLKNIFSSLPLDPEKKTTTFFTRLLVVVKCLKNLMQLLKNTPYRHYINHDIRQVEMLGSILESQSYIKDISDYHSDVDAHTKLLCAFIESLYYVLDLPEAFITSKKRNFKIGYVLEVLEKTGHGKIQGSETIGGDIQYFGIEGDMIILLGNIIKNAKKHGKAENVTVGVEEKDGIKVLVIQDDGRGISEQILGHIFEAGVSGSGSSGIGLRDMEKRGIHIQVSNNGLPSKYDTSKKGAKFEIQIL